MMLSIARFSLWLLLASSARATFEADVVHHTAKTTFLRKNPADAAAAAAFSLTETLLNRAVPLERRLEDNNNNNNNDDDYFLNQNALYSLSGYSLKYAKCQSIQRFSENAVKNGEYSSMVKDDIVIMRMCPSHSCSSSREFGCNYNYAEYAIGISDYIRIMLRYTMDKKDKMCDFCNTCFGNDDDDDNNNRRRRLEDDGQQGEQYQNGEENGQQGNNEQEENDNEGGDEQQNQEQGGEGEDEQQNEGGNDDGNAQQEFDDDDYYNADKDDDDAGAGDDAAAAAADDDDDNAGDDAYSECNNYKDACDDLNNYCQGNQDDDAGYLQYEDYFDYLDCVKIQGQDENYYWVKPYCDGYKGTIQMDIFYDPYCSQYAGNEINLREYSGIMFRKSIFEDYYSGDCIDCTEYNYGPHYGTNSQMCNKVYYQSARCTANMMYNMFDDEYDDSTNCAFIESVRLGTYNEKGEIYMSSDEFGETIEPTITKVQIAGLVISLVLCVLLGIYSCYLHHNITNLLIKSLSHSHLLPPSRHRSRSRQRSRTGKRKEDDWDKTVGAPA